MIRPLRFTVCLLLCCLGAAPRASAEDSIFTITPHADGSATYRLIDPDLVMQAQQHMVNGANTVRINDVVGANRFYAEGYEGNGNGIRPIVAANIEAGHIWSGHETLTHVTQFVHHASAVGSADGHATSVSHAMAGRFTGTPADRQDGIAREAELRSGAIATAFGGGGSFSLTATSLFHPYKPSATTGFGQADVINSSWGDASNDDTNRSGFNLIAGGLDGLAYANPNTTFVVSAGNSGPGTNTVGSPGAGYNNITVGALDASFTGIASFSSRAPQHYYDPLNGLITNVRAAVDIVAPGTSIELAVMFSSNTYGSTSGTSFSSPITAGAVALMKDAALGEGLPATALDTRVVKANMLNAASKVVGWNNGQSNLGGVITTTQSLDWTFGAGALDLNRTYDQYVTGQTDIGGVAGGLTTAAVGWDYAQVTSGAYTDVTINTLLTGGTNFNATLSWFRERAFIDDVTAIDVRQANLDLQIYSVVGGVFTTKIAESISVYNVVEHLSFTLPSDGYYGIRVLHQGVLFGTAVPETYAVAWSGTELSPAAANDSVITVTGDPLTVAFGRVMAGQTPSQNVTLEKTGAEATSFAVTPNNNGLTENSTGSFAAGTQNETFQLSLVANANGTNTLGSRSYTVVVDNTAADSAAPGQGSDDPNNTIIASATVVDDRVITASTVNFGTVITGGSVSGATTLTTTGSDDVATRVTVTGAAAAADGNGIGILAGSSQLFDGAADTALRTLAGTISSSGGLVSGTLNFGVVGEGLAGESVNPVAANYNVTVLDHANASFSIFSDTDTLHINFGSVLQNQVVSPLSFILVNLENTPSYTAELDLDSFASSGDVGVLTTNLALFNNLMAGGSNAQTFLASFNTSSVGGFSATYILNLSDQDGLIGSLGGQVLTLMISGTVLSEGLAVPEPATLSLWLIVAVVLGASAAKLSRRASKQQRF